MGNDLPDRVTQFQGANEGPLEFGPVEGVITDANGNQLVFDLILRFSSGTKVPPPPPRIHPA